MGFDLGIAPELAGRVRLGVLVLDGVSVRESDAALLTAMEHAAAELKARHSGVPSSEIPGAADARTLYKALGLDPTKTRPSSEALLRRVLRGEGLPRINTVVDAANLSSLRAQLPFGLYDLDQLQPPVLLRMGAPGEAYEGIRKGPVHVEGRPVLVDGLGPFGNPTSDSARSQVTLRTARLLVTVYAPWRYAPSALGAVLSEAEQTVTRHCGGARVHAGTLPG